MQKFAEILSGVSLIYIGVSNVLGYFFLSPTSGSSTETMLYVFAASLFSYPIALLPLLFITSLIWCKHE